jgi:hypothetical protein
VRPIIPDQTSSGPVVDSNKLRFYFSVLSGLPGFGVYGLIPGSSGSIIQGECCDIFFHRIRRISVRAAQHIKDAEILPGQFSAPVISSVCEELGWLDPGCR